MEWILTVVVLELATMCVFKSALIFASEGAISTRSSDRARFVNTSYIALMSPWMLKHITSPW
jgi:hypothetical protein